jgi:hypothetical protein
LDELDTFFQLYVRALEVKKFIQAHINQGALSKEQRDSYVAFIKCEGADRVGLQSLVIAAYSGFEDSCRQLIGNACAEISSWKISHSKLIACFPELPKWYFRLSGDAFRTVFEPLSHQKINFEELAENIATNIAKSPAVALYGNALSLNAGNIGSQQLRDIFRRFGFAVPWHRFQTDAELKKLKADLLTYGWSTAEQAIDGILDLRNRLAHSQGALGDVTPEKLVLITSFLRNFSRVLTELFWRHLVEKKPA